MKKVTCIIIAPIRKGDRIPKKCLDSVMNQDYGNFDVLIHYEKPIVYTKKDYPNMQEWMPNVYVNTSKNREIARKMALTTDADFFFFIDSDIELPKNAISSFMLQTGKRVTSMDFPGPNHTIIPKGTEIPEIHIQSGWYPIYARDNGYLIFYPCGKLTSESTILRYLAPEPSLIKADYIALGCCFITKEALSKIDVGDAGMDIIVKDERGNPTLGTEGLAFGDNAAKAGYQIYMNGDVICNHHKPYRRIKGLIWQLTQLYKMWSTALMALVTKSSNGTKLSQPQTT